MQRVRLTSTGFAQDLVYEASAEPLPPPTGTQVLVEVEACGVCYRDLIDRGGRFPFIRLPVTPGHEVAGRVVAVGPDARDFKVGDRVGTMHRDACLACERCKAGETSLCRGAMWVFGIMADGGYASALLAPESALFALPESLPAPQAAIQHCTFGTAYRDLVTLGRLQAGERVLVTGANGGVGSAAVQIAARVGAHVTAVVRDARHGDALRALGASEVLVDDGASFHGALGGDKVDLALDTVGVATFNASLRSLRIGGRLVVVGNIQPERASLNLGYLITNGLAIIGGSGATRADMAKLFALGPFESVIERTLPLAQADAAQRAVLAGGLRGRIVLVPG